METNGYRLLPGEGDDNRLFPLYFIFILVGKDNIY